MKLDETIEKKIKSKAIKFFDNRPNWGTGHVLNAVNWIKILIKEEGGNEKILLPSIYLHDIGINELKEGYGFDKELKKAKHRHAERGAELASAILKEFSDYFSKDEIKHICFLIAHHDKHEMKKSHELQLVFEADGLSQIDWKAVLPNFDKKNCEIWLKKYYNKRKSHMKTKTGIMAIKKLEKKAREYLKTMK